MEFIYGGLMILEKPFFQKNSQSGSRMPLGYYGATDRQGEISWKTASNTVVNPGFEEAARFCLVYKSANVYNLHLRST